MNKRQLARAWGKLSNLDRRTPAVILIHLRASGRMSFVLLPDLIPGNRPRIQFERYSRFEAALEAMPEIALVFNCTAIDRPGFWTHT